MIKRVRKWVNLPKKPSSFEERMNAQPDTFDIIKTQYSTEIVESDIQVFDDVVDPENELIINRSERLQSVEMVQKSSLADCANLSFEEQETLNVLDSAFEDHLIDGDDVIDDNDHVFAENNNNIVTQNDKTINYDRVMGGSTMSSNSSKVDNWSLGQRSQTSSGNFRMVQNNMYLPDTTSQSAIDADVTDDADYVISENHDVISTDEIMVVDEIIESEIRSPTGGEDQVIVTEEQIEPCELEIPELPVPDYPEEISVEPELVPPEEQCMKMKNVQDSDIEADSKEDNVLTTEQLNGDKTEVDQIAEILVTGDKLVAIAPERSEETHAKETKTAVGVVRGTSFNSPLGRAKLQIKPVLSDNLNNELNSTPRISETQNSHDTESKKKNLNIKTEKVHANTNVNETYKTSPNLNKEKETNKAPNIVEVTKIDTAKQSNISPRIQVTGFTRRSDKNNNNSKGPIITSFKAEKDSDLVHCEKKRAVNNMLRKWESMTS